VKKCDNFELAICILYYLKKCIKFQKFHKISKFSKNFKISKISFFLNFKIFIKFQNLILKYLLLFNKWVIAWILSRAVYHIALLHEYWWILLIDNFTVIWFVQCPSRGVLYFGRLTFADCTVTKNRLKKFLYFHDV
jgi:hypothetical protein